jgi:hypothetical protein
MPRAQIKGRGKPFKKGADPRRNVLGRPRTEESWAPNLREALSLSPKELAAIYPVLKPMLQSANAATITVPSIKAICARIVAALLFEPTASLATFVADRVDGKVPLPVDVSMTWRQELERLGYDPDEFKSRAVEQFAALVASYSAGHPGSIDGGGVERGEA